MKGHDVFPSKYIKAEDLAGRRVTVTIATVAMETLGDESKAVAYFVGRDKGLVLNRTNWQTIAMIAGSDESDDWHGVPVRLYATPVPFQGKIVQSIRIEAAPAQPSAVAAPPVRRPVPVEAPDQTWAAPPTDDSDVPF